MRQAGARLSSRRPQGKIPFENRALRPSQPPDDSPPVLERPVNEMPIRNGSDETGRRNGAAAMRSRATAGGHEARTPVLARTPTPTSTRPRRHTIGRQINVPSVGKFDITRENAPGAALDDKFCAVGELGWKSVDLAHDILALGIGTAPELPVPCRGSNVPRSRRQISVSSCGERP